jgi:hypothetical protein
MRHASEATTKRYYVTGNVQLEAGKLRELLSVPKKAGYTENAESS